MLFVGAVRASQEHVSSDEGVVHGHLCLDLGPNACRGLFGRPWAGRVIGNHDYHSVLVVVLLYFVVHPLCKADGLADVWELLGAGAGWVAWVSLRRE